MKRSTESTDKDVFAKTWRNSIHDLIEQLWQIFNEVEGGGSWTGALNIRMGGYESAHARLFSEYNPERSYQD
jgi:hypothetical protein